MLVWMWGKRYTHTLLVGLQIGTTIMESSMEIYQKTWNRLTFSLSCPSPWPINKGLKVAYYSDAPTSMYIAAQFTIARWWNKPRCPSIHEWIKKLWYIYIMKYYSVIKKKNIMAFADKWMELENIMLSEIS